MLAIGLVGCVLQRRGHGRRRSRSHGYKRREGGQTGSWRKTLSVPLLGHGSGSGSGGSGAGLTSTDRLDIVLGASVSRPAASYKIPFTELTMERVVGTGAWGRVYYGQYCGAPVAVKELVGFSVEGRAASGDLPLGKEQAAEEEARAARVLADFSKEAHILMALHHQAVVEFFGVSENPNDGMLYIVTEFCELDLGKLVTCGTLQQRYLGMHERATWLDLANQICSGMRYLHSQGIIHRDLKPDNVLLRRTALRPTPPEGPGGGGGGAAGGSDAVPTEAFAVKIADFGISKKRDETDDGADVGGSGRSGTLGGEHTRAVGTPLYMAPEVMAGERGDDVCYGGKVDVYSFGVLLWKLWCGGEPFSDVKGSLLSLMLAITKGTRPSMAGWPRGVRELISRCWAVEPGDRPSFEEIQRLLVHGTMFGSAEDQDVSTEGDLGCSSMGER